MTTKDIIDSVLRLLEIVVSWQVLALVLVVLVRRELPTLIAQLAERVTKAPGGFEFAVLQKRVESVQDRVETVAQTVSQIEQRLRFVPSAALTPDVLGRLQPMLTGFVGYLEQLGFDPPAGAVSVAILPEAGDEASYRIAERRIVLGPAVAGDADIALRSYAHHALSSVAGPLVHSPSFDWVAIELALATYFPCSYLNDPIFGETWAQESLGGPFLANLDNARTFAEVQRDAVDSDGRPQPFERDLAEIWGGAFWDLRKLLGQDRADRLLFQAWSAVRGPDVGVGMPSAFVRRLVDALSPEEQEQLSQPVREVFERRGVTA